MGSGIRPLKRLGQHFLRDRSVARRIVDSMEIGEGDHILEIGPGEGILTEYLLNSPASRIVGVEIDGRLVSYLKVKFGQDSRFELLEKNFLKFNLLDIIGKKKIRVVGNIPYSITTPILFHLVDHRKWVRDLTVTIQKEVGERIISPPGSKVYGIPSVFFQVFSRVESLFFVPGKAFYPIPKVDSMVLRFQFFDDPLYDIEDVPFFIRLVKTAFGQRRKMLKNTLKPLVMNEKDFITVSVDLHQRPEDLSVGDFVHLSNELARFKPRSSRGRDVVPKR